MIFLDSILSQSIVFLDTFLNINLLYFPFFWFLHILKFFLSYCRKNGFWPIYLVIFLGCCFLTGIGLPWVFFYDRLRSAGIPLISSPAHFDNVVCGR